MQAKWDSLELAAIQAQYDFAEVEEPLRSFRIPDQPTRRPVLQVIEMTFALGSYMGACNDFTGNDRLGIGGGSIVN
jgi:hypothetical protein